MTDKRRLFVSHSSHDGDLTRALCNHLKNAVGDEQAFDVLVDYSELEAGRPWPIQLHE